MNYFLCGFAGFGIVYFGHKLLTALEEISRYTFSFYDGIYWFRVPDVVVNVGPSIIAYCLGLILSFYGLITEIRKS